MRSPLVRSSMSSHKQPQYVQVAFSTMLLATFSAASVRAVGFIGAPAYCFDGAGEAREQIACGFGGCVVVPAVLEAIVAGRSQRPCYATFLERGERLMIVRHGVTIVDTFAEAFGMRAARVLITARSTTWARTAAQSMTGFATSVIGCKIEAGIEAELAPEETPDGRPGVSVLVFGFDTAGVGSRLVDRVGQTVLTCPTTACFDGLPEASERVVVGGQLRHFGDRYQSSKFLDGRRYWRIPVMEGEFLVEEAFGVQRAIGGGNFLILAQDQDAALT